MTKPITARSRRAGPVFVCRKCLKRHDHGDEIRRQIKRELKQKPVGELKPAKLVSASCFRICPKRAVVLASSKTLQNSEYLLVSREDEVGEALRAL